MSVEGEFLVVGHESGILALWDILNKTCIKTISPEGPPQPITSVRFYKRGKLSFFSADAQVSQLSFSVSCLR